MKQVEDRAEENDRRIEAATTALRGELEQKQIRLDRATRLLCAVMHKIETSGTVTYSEIVKISDGDVGQWWASHKLADKRRRDNLRASAIAKLTDDEKEALGLTRDGKEAPHTSPINSDLAQRG